MTWTLAQFLRGKKNKSRAPDEPAFVGELLSLERLEERAAELGKTHKTYLGPGLRQGLLRRLSQNETTLVSAYGVLSEAIRRERTLTPAAEWLVDNFHIVEEQLREVREDLPPGYYRLLPKLAEGDLAHYPRIYALAVALISHTDCRLDLETLKRFVRAYQREAPLSIGEVWAVAITLRVALLENLSRLAAFLINSREERERANLLADELLQRIESQPEEILTWFRRHIGEKFTPAFISQLSRRLRDQHTAISAALTQLDEKLIRRDQSINRLVQSEQRRQVATQVTVANIITSMRLLSTIDWRDFFESVSLIDPILNSDPAAAYSQMDFATRDRYRRVIERLARRTGMSELVIGQHVVDLAKRRPADQIEAHVGYYLIDRGLPDLEAVIGHRIPPAERFTRFISRHATFFYLGAIFSVSAFLTVLVTLYAADVGARSSLMIAIVLLSIIPVSELAINLVNWTVTSFFKPQRLPKIDTANGISEQARTMVVVPTMLSDAQTIDDLLERLEIHYLSNQDGQLHFALLTDFVDAPQEHLADDEMLLEQARAGMARLNARYCRNQQNHFHLFHRRRLWNESEAKWMGWERKRGKLHEFNRLLRGAIDTTFEPSALEADELTKVRYIITLDSDTRLPHDAARQLVGIITHPLNRAHFDGALGRVTRGYAIIQPRVSISLESASRSWFSRIFSGNTGVDPYTTAVSDVYQDLFSEGIYTGKGIYDIDNFEAAMAGRVPEDSLLSHDLFEGLFARAALATDVELFDDYPAQYDVFASRLHRWTRGDWQAAALRWLPNPKRVRFDQHRRLPLISSWKLLDNLRRSLFAPTLIPWLLLIWGVAPGSQFVWLLLAIAILAFPIYAEIAKALLFAPRRVSWTAHLRAVAGDLKLRALQVVVNLTFCAHQAFFMLDAISRTIYRTIISRRRLLEWVTAAQHLRMSARTFSAFLRFMLAAPLMALVIAAIVTVLNPTSLPFAAPFLLAWFLSPLVASLMSRQVSTEIESIQSEDVTYARLIARRTWRYFETVVSQLDHWLPPDNYQEDPHLVVAHRTSPTNIGLLLLATVAAHDFKYIGTLELIERLELTMTTLEKLPRFRGHFFNWYDTATLEPLPPRYVSTVDSGNLAGHLLVVKQACHELPDDALFDERLISGLKDTLSLLSQELQRLGGRLRATEAINVRQLQSEIDQCRRLLGRDYSANGLTAASLLAELVNHLSLIQDIVATLAQEHGAEALAELQWWVNGALHQTEAFRRDLETLTPSTSLAGILSRVDLYPPEISSELRTVASDLNSLQDMASRSQSYENTLLRLATLRPTIEASLLPDERDPLLDSLDSITKAVERAISTNEGLKARANSLAHLCDLLIDEMDFHFLFDNQLKVLTIGYNVDEGKRDNSFYDLFASEARLASFVAIATGDVPQEHWFQLGRPLTSVNGKRALISWSATMFEYLMPLLIMRKYDETLWSETYRTVVERQITYGDGRGVPWGISESAFNARSLDLAYQYAAFGVPGLGLKRGLGDNLVVAPYATLLAAQLKPREALANLRRLERLGALGRFGFYDALDFTPDRLPPFQKQAVVHAFMTHHQGMSLVALDNLLHDSLMQHRFHADPLVRANELLLQERVSPEAPITYPRHEEVRVSRSLKRSGPVRIARHYGLATETTPRLHLLSNGTYSVMVTTSGAGYSRCGAIAVTRWREDATRDHWGNFVYLRDVASSAVWSVGYQPALRVPQKYEVAFSEDKVAILREDVGVATLAEIIVSPEDNAELRRITLTNHSARVREIELTSYAEVALAPQAADVAHPAFGNLFIETEFVAEKHTLLARRRPRDLEEKSIFALHTMAAEGEPSGLSQYETDRSRFLGRGRTSFEPAAITEDRLLSNSVGGVLDPIFSLRRRVLLPRNASVRVCFTTAVADTRQEALALADKYHDPSVFEREARLAWTRSQVELRYLDVAQEEAQLFQELAARMLYPAPELRPRREVLALNSKTQEGLWRYGISGDLPILLLRIRESSDLRIASQLLRAHDYLRLKGLTTDLVILNDHGMSYAQELQTDLLELTRKSGSHSRIDKPGGIFLRRADLMPEADRILLHTVARVCIVAERGSLEDHLTRTSNEVELPPQFIPRRAVTREPTPAAPFFDLKFFNGLGGFSQDGREYVTILNEGQSTPAPWLNVIANPDFGFQISESGGGCTWSLNSRENRLTPWFNDAVSDPPSEIIYIRDESTGATWTPTPLPIRENSGYVIRHGQGSSRFEHTSHGIENELLVFVPIDAPVKISRLRLKNNTKRMRRVAVTAYHELTLGTERSASAPFIISEIDQTTRAVFARNPYHNEFAHRVAFADLSEASSSTCDRREFLGTHGSVRAPAALRRINLSGATGAGLDPCIAMQTKIDLPPDEIREIILLFGEAENEEEARLIINEYRDSAAVKEAFDKITNYWNEMLGAVEVRTPDAALNVMMNRWLPYQTLSCRLWARSGFYQSSGAYGFRDQLQDVMALVYGKPEIARAHILRAGGRQFREGDVQHWWHSLSNRGLRSRISDDPLWLPYVTSFYVKVTGDRELFNQKVPFLEAPVLNADQYESYSRASLADETASLFEHCLRAIDSRLALGVHGLPLIGTGDWNDGLNRVGHKGRGESVWLGWFLYRVLEDFAAICEERGDEMRSSGYRAHMDKLRAALEKSWDGDWYRRGFFDDGTPLGSATSAECQIDSISQSWSVISGAADPQRAGHAMAAVEQHLIKRGEGLVLLLTPPFDKSSLEPGYIKGYVPGVRENGGQYTHAALWTLIAYAMLGEGDRAGELLALLNPINHANTRAGLHNYRREPYVVAADVYAMPAGRGGWTWYTGAAAWMYRATLEFILGFKLRDDRLVIEPCVPRDWSAFELSYRKGKSHYQIKVENPHHVSRGVAAMKLDGLSLSDAEVQLTDDGREHEIQVVLGERGRANSQTLESEDQVKLTS